MTARVHIDGAADPVAALAAQMESDAALCLDVRVLATSCASTAHAATAR